MASQDRWARLGDKAGNVKTRSGEPLGPCNLGEMIYRAGAMP